MSLSVPTKAKAKAKAKDEKCRQSDLIVFLRDVMGRANGAGKEQLEKELPEQLGLDLKEVEEILETKNVLALFPMVCKKLASLSPDAQETYLDYLRGFNKLRSCSAVIWTSELGVELSPEEQMAAWIAVHPKGKFVTDQGEEDYSKVTVECKFCGKHFMVPHSGFWGVFHYEFGEVDQQEEGELRRSCSLRHPGLYVRRRGVYSGCFKISPEAEGEAQATSGWKLGEQICGGCLEKCVDNKTIVHCFAH